MIQARLILTLRNIMVSNATLSHAEGWPNHTPPEIPPLVLCSEIGFIFNPNHQKHNISSGYNHQKCTIFGD